MKNTFYLLLGVMMLQSIAQAGEKLTSTLMARAAANGPVVTHKVTREVLEAYPDMVYYLFVPSEIRESGRIFVSVHGISRNAREHAERFADYAERHGVVLVAPLYDRFNFPGYQRMAANADNQRPDRLLDMIVEEVSIRLGLDSPRLGMFGFSGGGQFVHRYLMAHPHRVERAVVGAAGWYTFPDSATRFPRGMRNRADQYWQPDFPAFLHVPVSVIVGEQDDQRDDALNKSGRIDRQQGSNRIERGRRWVRAMTLEARKQGFLTRYRFIAMPRVGHDFTRAMDEGDMGSLVFARLFNARSAGESCRGCDDLAELAVSGEVSILR